MRLLIVLRKPVTLLPSKWGKYGGPPFVVKDQYGAYVCAYIHEWLTTFPMGRYQIILDLLRSGIEPNPGPECSGRAKHVTRVRIAG